MRLCAKVAYQLRDHVEVLVGSEDLEPGPGWPHAGILGDLTKNPTMTGAELGATVVQRYVESYRHGSGLTVRPGARGMRPPRRTLGSDPGVAASWGRRRAWPSRSPLGA